MTQASTVLRAIISEIAALNFHSAADSPIVEYLLLSAFLKRSSYWIFPARSTSRATYATSGE